MREREREKKIKIANYLPGHLIIIEFRGKRRMVFGNINEHRERTLPRFLSRAAQYTINLYKCIWNSDKLKFKLIESWVYCWGFYKNLTASIARVSHFIAPFWNIFNERFDDNFYTHCIFIEFRKFLIIPNNWPLVCSSLIELRNTERWYLSHVKSSEYHSSKRKRK